MADIPVDPLSPNSEPAKHYDSVVDAWGRLLEEDLHYGYFQSGRESLVDATNILTNQMLKLAQPRSGEAVLDVGCGTGKAACRIAKEYGARVTGVSPSTVCIERANAMATAKGVTELARFQIADGTALPFNDSSFDLVWVMESSHLMPDKAALISESARVLCPGGRLVLCDIILHRKLPLQEMLQHRDEFLLLRDVFGRAVMETPQFYVETIRACGMEMSALEDISNPTYCTFDRWRHNALKNRESVTELIGKQSWEQFLVSCDVLESFWSRKILGYGILSAKKSAIAG
ncbi:MAG: methyltransferase domain-containing protein [Halioglobus sp.]|nr:methyltransferase domain-containing protein [Halioglobus sp.]